MTALYFTKREYAHEFDSVGSLKRLSAVEDQVDRIIHARDHPRSGAYYLPTVAQALGVPAIQRAVSLIASTTGMLSMQGFRNGELSNDPPKLLVRPDPDETPYSFYAMTAAQMAKYGEFVWWIANRDGDGIPNALVNVPLNELRVDVNPDNRRYSRYQWGNIKSTRYSPANQQGQFVHKKYPIGEPLALRGEGPLQMGQIAVSISVESQVWAANFYGGGGHPSDIIKHAGQLDPTLRDELGEPNTDTGLSEADRLKSQYAARDPNTPLVIDQMIESITAGKIDEAGAQMLEARLHQNGDAARLFGLPGKFVEYVQSGTSLTYQTLESAFTDLVKTCLQPLYLEPIEQAMSDLLTRSWSARFNVKGFLRADIKTRYEVHGMAIDKGIYGPEYAQQEEGIVAGDVEYAPIPFAPPQAVPTTLPRAASLAHDVRCPSCNKLIAKTLGAGSELNCPRCKALIRGEAIESAPETVRSEIHVHLPENMVSVPVTVQPADIHVAPPSVTVTNPATTLEVTMPDTEARIADLGSGLHALTSGLDGLMARQSIAHEENQARLTEVAQANREVASQLKASLKPRKVTPIRDPDTKQIVGMTTEAA